MSEKFINLDNDETIDVWSINQIAAKIIGTEGSYNVYALASEMGKWHASEDIQTPRPAIRFRGDEFWKASEETVDAWVLVIEQQKLAAENKAWTKGELVDKALHYISKSLYPTSQTKIANRDAYNRAAAIYDFVCGLDQFGIPDKVKKEKMWSRIQQLKTQGGLK